MKATSIRVSGPILDGDVTFSINQVNEQSINSGADEHSNKRIKLNVEATPSVTAFVLRLLKAQPSNRLELQKESPALYDELAPAINVILKCVPLIKALEKELENELKVNGDTVDGWFNRAVIDLLAANIEMYTMLSIIYGGGLFRSTNGVFRGSEIDLFRRFVLDPISKSLVSHITFRANNAPSNLLFALEKHDQYHGKPANDTMIMYSTSSLKTCKTGDFNKRLALFRFLWSNRTILLVISLNIIRMRGGTSNQIHPPISATDTTSHWNYAIYQKLAEIISLDPRVHKYQAGEDLSSLLSHEEAYRSLGISQQSQFDVVRSYAMNEQSGRVMTWRKEANIGEKIQLIEKVFQSGDETSSTPRSFTPYDASIPVSRPTPSTTKPIASSSFYEPAPVPKSTLATVKALDHRQKPEHPSSSSASSTKSSTQVITSLKLSVTAPTPVSVPTPSLASRPAKAPKLPVSVAKEVSAVKGAKIAESKVGSHHKQPSTTPAPMNVEEPTMEEDAATLAVSLRALLEKAGFEFDPEEIAELSRMSKECIASLCAAE